jgi:hypothetical protein
MKISIEYELPQDNDSYKLLMESPMYHSKINKIYSYIGEKIYKEKLNKEELKTLQDIIDIIKEGSDK